MSTNQASPDAKSRLFESFDRQLNYKREGYESAENTTSIGWDSNPILKRVSNSCSIISCVVETAVF